MKNKVTAALFIFIFLLALGSSTSIFPKHLYVYWHTPMETAPLLIQLCVQRMQMACAQANWNFTVLNDTNLAEHLPNYQQKYLPVANAAKHPGWKASVADLIRLAIIEQNGGMYLDISTILFRGLKWLERLEDFPYLLTNSQIHQGKFPDVLQPYFTHYQNIVQQRHPDRGITNIEPGYESWCLIAKPKAAYVTALRNRHAHHYTNTEWDNKIQDFQKDYYLRGVFSDYLNNQKSAYEVIQDTQFQLDKNLTIFGQRTNANQHLNVVAFRAEYGPFSFLINLVKMQRVYTHTLDQIYQQDKIPLFFFMKMTSQDRPFVENQLNLNVEIAQKYENIRQSFDKFLESKPSAEQCKDFKFIVEGSVMGHLVSQSKIAKEKRLYPISVEQRQKWWDYCQKTHKVSHNLGLNPDGRVSQVFNQWVLPYTQIFLSEQNSNKIRQLFNQIAILCAFSNHGYYGGFSDVQQTYYWRKVFQQRNPQILNPTPNPFNQFVKTRPIEDYSFFQSLELRLGLYVFSNRTTLAYKLKLFILFLVFTCILGFLFLIITFIVKALFLGFKPTIKFIPLLWACIKQQNQRESLSKQIKQIKGKIAEYLQRVCGNIKRERIPDLLFWFAPIAMKYIVKKTLILLLCGAFIAYNAVVAFQYYYVIYFGKIYFQELTYILFIIIQILFRKTFQIIGNDQWGISGLTLGQLYRIFLPVYTFSLGASIVNMAERTQVRNLALSVSLCMILPLFVKEIDFQLKKIDKIWRFEEIPKTIRIPQLKIAAKLGIQILLNFANSVEIIVILFLGINAYLPNLRFIVHNNEIYTVKKFFHSLESLVQFSFVVLTLLYLAQISEKFKQRCFEQNISSLTAGKSSSLNSEIEMKIKSKESFGKHSLQDEMDRLRTERTELQTSRKTFSELLAVFLQFIFYGFKLWIFYWLAYTKWSEILVRNTFNIEISQQMPGIEYYLPALNVMAILIIFFVSREAQNVIEQVFMNFGTKAKRVSKGKVQGSRYIDIKEEAEDSSERFYKKYERRQVKQIRNTTMELLILACLTLFLIPRYNLLDKIWSYLMAIDTKDGDTKGNLEKQFYDLKKVAWILTACCFRVIKEILINWNSFSVQVQQKQSMDDKTNEYSLIGSPTNEYLNGQNTKEQQQMA